MKYSVCGLVSDIGFQYSLDVLLKLIVAFQLIHQPEVKIPPLYVHEGLITT